MKRLIIIPSLLVSFIIFGQTNNKGTFKVRKLKSDSEVFQIVEVMPSFPGGQGALIQFLATNTNYPSEAKVNNISGTVYVTFVVNKDGTIRDVRVIRGVTKLLDEEAIRVVKLMPKWIPGKTRGKNVDVAYNIPIKFILK